MTPIVDSQYPTPPPFRCADDHSLSAWSCAAGSQCICFTYAYIYYVHTYYVAQSTFTDILLYGVRVLMPIIPTLYMGGVDPVMLKTHPKVTGTKLHPVYSFGDTYLYFFYLVTIDHAVTACS